MLRPLAISAALLALALPSQASASSASAARSCGNVSFQQGTDYGAFGIRARNVGCRTARRVARASRDHGPYSRSYRYRARGFTCRGTFSTDALAAVRYRCRRGDATIRFTRT